METQTQVVRCPKCRLLVRPARDHHFGNIKFAVVGNHEPNRNGQGFAIAAQSPVCDGSVQMGEVVDADNPSGFKPDDVFA